MKIANFKLTKENLPMVVSAVIAVILIMVYIIFYIPLIGSLREKYSECKSQERQVIDARNIVSGGKVLSDRVLLTEKDVSVAMDELTTHGKKEGIIFHSIKPGEMVVDSGEQYKILPIEMDIEANDEHMSAFIGSLDELSKGLMRIKGFDITPLKDDRTKLAAKLVVEMYFSTKEYEK